jgi:hypothetical protein
MTVQLTSLVLSADLPVHHPLHLDQEYSMVQKHLMAASQKPGGIGPTSEQESSEEEADVGPIPPGFCDAAIKCFCTIECFLFVGFFRVRQGDEAVG